MNIRTAFGAACVTALAGLLAAEPATAADFYAGKQMRLIVGSDTGGGYDTFARLIARHWPDAIPGHPTIVVQNMPGASSLKALNEVANNAPKDGTVVGAVQNNIAFEPLLNLSGASANARFDPLTINWIGSASKEVAIAVVWHTTAIKTLEDAMTHPVKVGASGPATSTSITARVFNASIGTKFDIVGGYKSQTEINLAMERGEVEGTVGWLYSSLMSTRGDWLPSGKIRIIAQAALEKHPALPDVPLILDYAKTPEIRKELELAFASLAMGRPYLAPPGVPADRVKLLQATFLKALATPALEADAKKLKLEVSPLSGEDVHKLLAEQYATPKSIVAKVKAMLTGKDK